MRARRRGSNGFTLVEMILAVTLFATVAGAAAGCLAAGIRVWQRGRQAAATAEIFLSLESFARDFRCAAADPEGFEGGKSEFSFPLYAAEGPLRVTYRFDTERKALFYRKSPAGTDSKELTGTEWRAAGLDSARFLYYQPGVKGSRGTWEEDWAAGQGIVPAVRVEGTLDGQPVTKTVRIGISR